MKSAPAILFAILLTGLVHITVSEIYSISFDKFLQRLEKSVKTSAHDVLPFNQKYNLIEDLKKTSDQFKEHCLQILGEINEDTGETLAVKALGRTINRIFNLYKGSARRNKNIVKEIQAEDPIGLNIYLNKNNVDENSQNFMEFVEKFRRIMYTKMPIGDDSKFYMSDFHDFFLRLEENMKKTALPFTLKLNLFEDLRVTSAKFKNLCIQNDIDVKKKTGDFQTVSSLNKTIGRIFYRYKEGAKENRNIVKEIQGVDPIGFNAYLTKKNESFSSPTFMQSVEEFRATMYDRVRLFNSRTDNSQIEVYPGISKKKLYEFQKRIPEIVRDRITTEYRGFDNFTIDFFVELAMEQFRDRGIKMYRPCDRMDMNNFKQHKSNKIDDVQILISPKMPKYPVAHAVCVYYQASSQNVLIYDSSMFKTLDEKQFKILDILYPFKKEIIYVKSRTRQQNSNTCGIFSTIYATMLLLKSDPAKNAFKVNRVYGDESLYMRLHILNMFANRKLTLMK